MFELGYAATPGRQCGYPQTQPVLFSLLRLRHIVLTYSGSLVQLHAPRPTAQTTGQSSMSSGSPMRQRLGFSNRFSRVLHPPSDQSTT